MSDSDFTSRLGFEVDQASIERAKAALSSVTNAVKKSADDVLRANQLDAISKGYAKIAASGKGAINVTDDLVKELALIGATEKEIDKTVKAFDRQVEAIQRVDRAQQELEERPRTRLDRFEDVEGASGKVGDVGDAAAALGSAIGSEALSNFGAIFEGIEALARLKEGLAALPESLTATAQAAGLMRSAQQAGSAATGAATAAEGAQTVATTGLTAASGGATVGIGAMLVALAPIAAVGLVIAAAFAGLAAIIGSLQARTAEATEALKRQYDAQDTIDAFVAGGATVEQAIQRQTDLQNEAVNATNRFNEATKALADDFAARAAKNGDLVARLQDLFNIDSQEDAIKERIKETGDKAKDTDAELKELNKAIDDNRFATDKAATTNQKAAAVTSESSQRQIAEVTRAYQTDEATLAQHLANETGLKGQAYNQQISMGAQAVAAIQNGFRPLNMSGASNSFKPGSFGGLRPIGSPTNNTVNRSVGNLTINTTANPQDVIKVLNDVGLVG